MSVNFRANVATPACTKPFLFLGLMFLLLFLPSIGAAENYVVNCNHPTYSRITKSDALHGYALLDMNKHGELLAALDEDGFSDISSGTGVTDKVLRFALKNSSDVSRILDFWKRGEPREVRLIKRSAAGYSEVELHLLEHPFGKWAFVLDAYGCSDKIADRSDALSDDRFAIEALSTVRMSGKRLSLEESLNAFDDSPLVQAEMLSGPSRAFCGHGGPDTLSCSVSLPFGFGCSAECAPGAFACCNTFGGCTCMPDPADDSGDEGGGAGDDDAGGEGGGEGGGGGGGGLSPPGGGSGGGSGSGGGASGGSEDAGDIVCSYDEGGNPIPGNPSECPDTLPNDEIRP